MATKTLTESRQRELVLLRMSIPVSDLSEDDSGGGDDKFRWSGTSTPDEEDEDASTGRASCSSAAAAPRRCSHNRHNRQSLLTLSDVASFEGDQINPSRFRWMSLIPHNARRGLLLSVDPVNPVTKFAFPDENSQLRQFNTAEADLKPKVHGHVYVMEDFCVYFSHGLLKKLRERQSVLLAIATRTNSKMYVKKTLLLRGTARTRTWTKYFMCRVCSPNRGLLSSFYRQLEQFDMSFGTRYSYKHTLPRVTLVPNRTVPENTMLSMTLQRLRKSDFYFGKMPLLPDPFFTNMASRLTRPCVNERSLLAQMVVLE